MSDYVDTVDIEGVQYDIQDTPTKEQAEENAQDISEMKASQNYSTTEHLTGRKWLDGKPTYTIIVNTGALPNTTSKTIPLPVQNIDTIIKYRGCAKNPTLNEARTLPYPAYLADNIIAVYIRGNEISIVTGADYSAFTESYIEFEYTKTTDSPQP